MYYLPTDFAGESLPLWLISFTVIYIYIIRLSLRHFNFSQFLVLSCNVKGWRHRRNNSCYRWNVANASRVTQRLCFRGVSGFSPKVTATGNVIYFHTIRLATEARFLLPHQQSRLSNSSPPNQSSFSISEGRSSGQLSRNQSTNIRLL